MVENLPAMQETWVHRVAKSQIGLSNYHTHTHTQTHTHTNSVMGLPVTQVVFRLGY